MDSLVAARLLTFPQAREATAISPSSERAIVPADPSDELLLSLVAKSDKEALTLLFRRHAPLVRGIGLRILRDAGEAEDLVQEVFLYLYRKAGLFDPTKSSARSWFVQVIYYHAIARRRYLLTRHYLGALRHPENTAGTPEPIIFSQSHSEEILFSCALVSEVWQSLTAPQRETLRLFFFEGYTLSEISARLGEPLGNVRHHYYRGLDRLRARLLAK